MKPAGIENTKMTVFTKLFEPNVVRDSRGQEPMSTILPKILKTLTFASAFMLVATMVIPGDGNVAMAGEIELTDLQNAKLARHRAKERVMKNEKQEDYLPEGTPNNQQDEDGDCGTVDIGNVVNNAGFGGPREIDVIITGDIINANNKCN